jgi:hypothetical protein
MPAAPGGRMVKGPAEQLNIRQRKSADAEIRPHGEIQNIAGFQLAEADLGQGDAHGTRSPLGVVADILFS